MGITTYSVPIVTTYLWHYISVHVTHYSSSSNRHCKQIYEYSVGVVSGSRVECQVPEVAIPVVRMGRICDQYEYVSSLPDSTVCLKVCFWVLIFL